MSGPSKSLGWSRSSEEFTQRHALVEVYGDEGTGKTTFALSAPGPIALLHCSEKIEGIVQEVTRRGVEVQEYDFGGVFKGSADKIRTEAKATLKGFHDALADAYTWARSIVVDTHTDLWTLYQLAAFGTQTPKSSRGSFEWGPVTAMWKSRILVPPRSGNPRGANVVLVGKTKDEYKGPAGKGTRTGKTIRAGQKDIPFISDARYRTKLERNKAGDWVPSVVIEKAWMNELSYRGFELKGELATFSTAMSLITETDEEGWT